MQKYLYQLYCEWDIGQENKVFSSIDLAYEWAAKEWDELGMDDDCGMTLEEAREDYYIGVQMVELVA